MNELVKCAKVQLEKTLISQFASVLYIILVKANSRQIRQSQTRLSPISQSCTSDRSVCRSTISFMSSSDVLNQEVIVFPSGLIIVMKRQ